MITAPFWNQTAGKELDTTPLPERAVPKRVVACLNVWNDHGALMPSIGTWKKFVDHVIVVDGSYDTIGRLPSTDGTIELLRSQFTSIEVIDGAGMTQCEKRTAYLDCGKDGDYLFIVDADEHVLNGAMLRTLPVCDIGWIRMRSSIYQREYGQPRIIRWRPGLHYSGRHHWMYEYEQLFCTHQYGGPGYAHRPVSMTITNQRGLGRTAARSEIKRDHLASQMTTEAPLSATPRSLMSDSTLGARECLWILNYAYRDDGLAPSRLHSAINRTTPHASVFFKQRPGPFGVQTQFDVRADNAKMTTAIAQCDIVHIHTVVSTATPIRRMVPHVFHHHGSLLRANAVEYLTEAKKKQALVLVSNLELLSWTGDYPAFFLPNVVPVARYRSLAESQCRPFDGAHPFRIVHSPTKAERKGTVPFLAACARLQKQGLPIEVVMIENHTHADTLRIKASCHAAFDSFWLGMQCSGLEAAAMGMPVIAGDPTVASRYREQFGSVPYTYANTEEELEAALRRIVEDADFRINETNRVNDYVTNNHDESAVALTYLDYLDMAFHWREGKKRHGALSPQSQLRFAEAIV